jgi:hypothetical protein
MDLFASLSNAHYPMSEPPGHLSLDTLAHDCPGLELYAFPPFSPDPGCAGQDQDGGALSAAGGLILAKTTLVQPSPVPVVWDTFATSPETRPTVSGWGKHCGIQDRTALDCGLGR